MRKIAILFALPYLVTVTDLGQKCDKLERKDEYTLVCLQKSKHTLYHLSCNVPACSYMSGSITDCEDSAVNDCKWMYDASASLNMLCERQLLEAREDKDLQEIVDQFRLKAK